MRRRCGLSCGLRWCSTTGRATRRATSCAPWCATTAAITPPTRAPTRGPAPRCCLPRAFVALLHLVAAALTPAPPGPTGRASTTRRWRASAAGRRCATPARAATSSRRCCSMSGPRRPNSRRTRLDEHAQTERGRCASLLLAAPAHSEGLATHETHSRCDVLMTSLLLRHGACLALSLT